MTIREVDLPCTCLRIVSGLWTLTVLTKGARGYIYLGQDKWGALTAKLSSRALPGPWALEPRRTTSSALCTACTSLGYVRRGERVLGHSARELYLIFTFEKDYAETY